MIPVVEKLVGLCTDWDDTRIPDEGEPRVPPNCATLREAAKLLETLVDELALLRSGMEQSAWHNIPGGRAKRILIAESAIERIDTALAAARGEQA